MELSIAQSQDLEDAGYCAYYCGVPRSEMATDAERRGWDEAYGEDCYFKQICEELDEYNNIGRDESLYPWQF